MAGKLKGLDSSSESSSVISKISDLRLNCDDIMKNSAESDYEGPSWDDISYSNISENSSTPTEAMASEQETSEKVKLLGELKKSVVEDIPEADLQSISNISPLLNITGINENKSFYLPSLSSIEAMCFSPQISEEENVTKKCSLKSRKSLNFSTVGENIKTNLPSANPDECIEGIARLSILSKKDHDNPKPQKKSRIWNRRNACIYCNQLITNFSRHIVRNHATETEVIQYLSINEPDPNLRKLKRQKITDILRNRGNFKHNSKVAFEKEGVLLPCKRNVAKTDSPSNFVTCKSCLGTYKRSTFYRHFKVCGKKDLTENDCWPGAHKNRVLRTNSISIVPSISAASKELIENIIPRLRSDDISLIIQRDPLILAFGSRLLKKKKERRSRKSICSRMRDLATLLKIVREKDKEIETLEDIIDPNKYEIFIESVKEMCGFNEETGFVNIISIPARIRPAILGCIDILYTKMIMSHEYSSAYKETYKKKLDDFKLLLEVNWQWEISSNAEKTRKRLNMTKENVLPLDEDIAKLTKKINQLENKYFEKLSSDINIINYEHLCEITIAHIILLDRKRAGDVAEAELVFYLNRKTEDIPEKILKTLTPQQKKCMNDLELFHIPGKRTRSVPILLTKNMRQNIDLIISCRPVLKISDTNPYLFARPFTNEPFDGCKCLDKIKKMCYLKRPDMITSTGMRHHIATMSQVEASQSDKFTEHLAGFLGHDMTVHSKNYRLPLQVIQKAVVGSKLLEYENYGFNEQSKTNKRKSKITATITSKDLENVKEQSMQDKQINVEEKTLENVSKEQNETISLKGTDAVFVNNDNIGENTICSNPKTSNKKRKLSKDKTESSEKGEEEVLALSKKKAKYAESVDPKGKITNQVNNIKKETINKRTIVLRKRKSSNLYDQKFVHGSDEETEAFDDIETDRSDYENDKKGSKRDNSASEDSEEEIDIKKKRHKVSHRKWTKAEIDAVKKHFKENIAKKLNPGKAKCIAVLKKEHILRNRTWMQLNTYVNNIYKKKGN